MIVLQYVAINELGTFAIISASGAPGA